MTVLCDTAVILAAGLGKRLDHGTSGRPKGLLRFGEAPIIEESILKLRRRGLTRILVVTGYGAAHFESVGERVGGNIELIYNDDFETTGSMHSFCCAAELLNDTFLLLESDLIYEARALDEVINPANPDIVLVSTPTQAGDEVWIEADNRRCLIAMSKNRHALGCNIIGELVGICKISPTLCRAMLCAGMERRASSVPIDYEDCLTDAAADHPVKCIVIDDLAWAEIDTSEHLARARDVVYPEIIKRESTESSRP